MKRMIGMVAAMALATSTAAYAQNTLPEIHQFFTVTDQAHFVGGVATLLPTDMLTNPVINAAPGSHVYLAVWIRALQGNSAGPLGVTSYNYAITGQGGTGFAAGGRRQRDLGGSYVPTPGSPTPGTGTDYVDLPGVDSELFGLSGATSGAGTNAEINSSAAGDGLGAFMVQVIDIVAGTAGTLNLYLTTPKTGGALYATSGNVGSLSTVAFGADATGGLDRKRASVPTQDIIGTLNDRVSTTPDATITVPEPGTLGLLALGLLGLRRRRN